MLARILPILSVIVLAAVAYYMFQTGILSQMIRPTVDVAYANRSVVEGQRLRESMIEMRQIPISSLPTGVIVFESATTPKEAVAAFEGQTASRKINQGEALTSAMFGISQKTFALRVVRPVEIGGQLDANTLVPVQIDGVPPSGAIVFETADKAMKYVETNFTLTAQKMMSPGSIFTIDDLAGGESSVFVIRASRDFASREVLRAAGMETAEVRAENLTPGVIAFPDADMATIFMTSIDRYSAVRRINLGDIVTADLIGAEEGVTAKDIFEGLPQSLAELKSYESAYPGEVLRLRENRIVGDMPSEDETVDIWIETNRTTGAFGHIKLSRIVVGQDVLSVYNEKEDEDPETIGSDGSIEGDVLALASPAVSNKTLWLSTKPQTTEAFEAVRELGRAAFVIRSGTSIIEALGNGASCRGDVCLVDRDASNEMSAVFADLPPDAAQQEVAVVENEAVPLHLLDGVSTALAQRLRDNGYGDFNIIAEWNDVEITPITYRLDISSNLALYIRQQARNIVAAPVQARSTLGIAEAPQE